ncbi:Protein CBG25794 [Caenorhabditis briggsae]|uniref:Protein CBG25794 n=1 Tax=Caenorhabditis briggsae TaxID=6238 RepID=B6IGL7_CAEBR|nr:Protein CBG25794 [Caenorhabditis briggsae]CAR99047.1 Protein CBG25794 [Caenorhabditis briggsae]
MDGSGGDLKLDLLLDNEDDEEVKKRKKKFEVGIISYIYIADLEHFCSQDELKIMKNKKLQTGKAERTTEGLKTSKGDSEDNTKEKTADKTQENSKTSEEKPEKKVSEKVPEKIPERIPEKVPEKVPEKPDKSKKSQAKSVNDPKPNPERSVIQTSNYPKSVYENMDPNVHIPVGVDKTPPDKKMETQRTPMKDSKKSNTTKKKNPCCSIL